MKRQIKYYTFSPVYCQFSVQWFGAQASSNRDQWMFEYYYKFMHHCIFYIFTFILVITILDAHCPLSGDESIVLDFTTWRLSE